MGSERSLGCCWRGGAAPHPASRRHRVSPSSGPSPAARWVRGRGRAGPGGVAAGGGAAAGGCVRCGGAQVRGARRRCGAAATDGLRRRQRRGEGRRGGCGGGARGDAAALSPGRRGSAEEEAAAAARPSLTRGRLKAPRRTETVRRGAPETGNVRPRPPPPGGGPRRPREALAGTAERPPSRLPKRR